MSDTSGQEQVLTSGCPNPRPSEGLPESHSTQGGRRAPVAVRATSALAGLSRCETCSRTTTRKEPEGGRTEEIEGRFQKKKEEPQPQLLFPKEAGILRDQNSPERTKNGVSKGNPLNR